MIRPISSVLILLACVLAACEERQPNPASAPPTTPPAVSATPAPAAPPELAADAKPAEPPTNTKCPVSGEEVDPHDPKLITVEYNGKTYGLCCKDCIEDFKKHPEKYVQK